VEELLVVNIRFPWNNNRGTLRNSPLSSRVFLIVRVPIIP